MSKAFLVRIYCDLRIYSFQMIPIQIPEKNVQEWQKTVSKFIWSGKILKFNLVVYKTQKT